MHGTLDFGLKNKVAIVAGGGAFRKILEMEELPLYCSQKLVQR